MNMISTGAFLNEMDASDKQHSVAEKFAAVWEKKNAKAARAGGVSLMALSLAACGGSSSTTTTTTTPAEPTAPAVDPAATVALTAFTDNAKGGSGDDLIAGVVQAHGGTGTTVQAGDIVDGGDGTDTFAITLAGAHDTTAYTVSGVQTKGVEHIVINNFETDNALLTNIDTTLMDGYTSLGLASSSASGDTKFTNVVAVTDAVMKNGAANLEIAYLSTAISGTADVQDVAIANLTGGEFKADGTETVNVTTSLAKSTLGSLVSNALKEVNISGDQNLTISTALNFASNGTASTATVAAKAGAVVDASGLSGDLTITTTASEIFNIKGGSGDDTFNLASLTKDDVLDGGAGDDTAKITAHDAASGALKMSTLQFSNVENFSVEATSSKETSINADGTTVSNIILVENDTTSINAAISNLAAGQSVTINSNVDAQDVGQVTLGLKDPAGTSDALTVNVNGTSGQGAEAIESIITADIETINLTSGSVGTTAMVAADSNVLTNMNVGLGTNLNISGAANLTFTNAITGTKLTTIDASGLSGKLSIVGAANDVTLTGGSAADTLTMGTTLTAKDTIDGGAGDDTLTAEMNGVGTTDAHAELSIANVETISMQTVTGASFLNMAGVTGATTLNIGDKNSAAGVATTLSNLSAGTKIGLGGLATDKEYTGTLTVGLADETGSADNITFVLADTNSDNDVNATIKVGTGTTTITTGVESITVQASTDATANNATLDLSSMGAATVNVTKGAASEIVALGTLNKNTTTLDASAFDGLLSVTGSASATTMNVKFGSSSNTITLGTGDDTLTIADLNADDAAGGTGTDSLTATINDAAVTEATTGFENITYNIANNTQTTVTGANGKGIDTAKTFTLTGGDALTTYAHDLVSPTALTTYDMSGYTGKSTALTVAATARDLSEVTITGSAGADTVTVTTNNNDFLVKSMTGVETLVINAAGGATAFDFSKTTGITTVKTDDDDTARDITLTDLTDGTSVEITTGTTASGLIVDMANKSSAGNSLDLKVKTVGASSDVIDIDIDEVETTTIDIDTATTLDLAGLSMTSGTSTLKLTGDSAVTISALHADVTTVDASGMKAGGSVTQSARSSTAAVNYTGSTGDDTFIMALGTDTLDGGEKTGDNDTLDVNFSAVLGAINVDLSSSTDQVTVFNGLAETTVQKGFESVDLAGYANHGAQVVGSDVANTVTGTGQSDTMSLGKGDDILTVSAGNDVVDMGAGADTIKATATLIEANSGTTATYVGGAGTDILQITGATTGLVDADLRGITTVETLTLANGTNSIALGANAVSAGIVTVNGGTTAADTITMTKAFAETTGLAINFGTTGTDTIAISGSGAVDLTGASISSADALTVAADAGADAIKIKSDLFDSGGATTAATLTITGGADGDDDTLTIQDITTVFESAAETNASDVDSAGEWHLADVVNDNVLTYYNEAGATVVTLTIIGLDAGAVTVTAGDIVWTA